MLRIKEYMLLGTLLVAGCTNNGNRPSDRVTPSGNYCTEPILTRSRDIFERPPLPDLMLGQLEIIYYPHDAQQFKFVMWGDDVQYVAAHAVIGDEVITMYPSTMVDEQGARFVCIDGIQPGVDYFVFTIENPFNNFYELVPVDEVGVARRHYIYRP